MIKVQFSARDGLWPTYEEALGEACADLGLKIDLSRDHAPETVDYIVFAPNGPVTEFPRYTRCKAVLGLWAGVESIVGDATLTQPFARMVDDGLTEGMVEWVTGHVLRHHLGLDQDICRSDAEWDIHIPPLARDRRVGILGLGALGAACGAALAQLNFDVAGWSRSPKDLPGIACHHGDAGLADVLAHSEILVLLLPRTPATENVLNARTLAQMPKGAVIINPGRGPLIDDEALLAALETGQVSHATLDVFRVEPLPEGHAFWAHPNVTVTPHIASETRPVSAARVIAENIRRGEVGEPFLHLVDRTAGY
ncbi:glyoxylate/hydroxypyruvate reductase A [Aliiroseovarius subalbicans]|uniref:2-hydroxyacid dehydrogenase n=1 Tax=Aliiroseovarius subalbicans TaxID=2925840 RepID=UPI001F5909A9|nr:glyoxylate/hydroxypyruvate reductase A [Aliiroseovarius subalbicans]MCI2399344.1 glyoxylate/hydroxypyruvate reductase A [Aliiroseovarius subalbicans]